MFAKKVKTNNPKHKRTLRGREGGVIFIIIHTCFKVLERHTLINFTFFENFVADTADILTFKFDKY